MLKLRRNKSGSSGLILLYHRVTTLASDPWQLAVSPRHFRQQMQWVRDNCCVVPLVEMLSALRHPSQRKPLLAMTFDDGYADNLHEALPVLEQCGIPATFFLTIPWLGPPHEFWWDQLERVFLQSGKLPPVLRLVSDADAPTWHLGDAAQYTPREADANRHWRAREHPPTVRHEIYATLWTRLYKMMPEQRQRVLDEIFEWAASERAERPTHRRMDQDEVTALSRSSLVEIGAHSVSHPALPALPLADRRREIGLGQGVLAEIADRPVTSFAFPHGDRCPTTARLVRQAGFLRACTTHPRPLQKGQDAFELPRFCVGNWDGKELAERVTSWSTYTQD